MRSWMLEYRPSSQSDCPDATRRSGGFYLNGATSGYRSYASGRLTRSGRSQVELCRASLGGRAFEPQAREDPVGDRRRQQAQEGRLLEPTWKARVDRLLDFEHQGEGEPGDPRQDAGGVDPGPDFA